MNDSKREIYNGDERYSGFSQDDIETILQTVYAAHRLNTTIIDESAITSKDFSVIGNLDYHFRGELYIDYDYMQLFNELTEHAEVYHPIEYTDNFNCHYLVMKSLDSVEPDYRKKGYLIVGPFLISSMDNSNIIDLLEANNIPFSLSEVIKHYIYRVPVLQDYISFMAILMKLGSEYQKRPVIFNKYSSNKFNGNDVFVNKNLVIAKPEVHYAMVESRYEIGNRLLDAVRRGDIPAALKANNDFMGFKLEARTTNAIRDAKDTIIALCGRMEREAELATVHPLYIDNFSRRILPEIESCTSMQQLSVLCSSLIRRFCLLVKSYSRSSYSPIVRDIMNYVDFNFKEDISLQFFSEKHHISKSYLSAKFHEEVGESLSTYINKTRINKAIQLLNTTDYSMQKISDECGFCDSNYFARTFKKYQHISPVQYKNTIKS